MDNTRHSTASVGRSTIEKTGARQALDARANDDRSRGRTHTPAEPAHCVKVQVLAQHSVTPQQAGSPLPGQAWSSRPGSRHGHQGEAAGASVDGHRRLCRPPALLSTWLPPTHPRARMLERPAIHLGSTPAVRCRTGSEITLNKAVPRGSLLAPRPPAAVSGACCRLWHLRARARASGRRATGRRWDVPSAPLLAALALAVSGTGAGHSLVSYCVAATRRPPVLGESTASLTPLGCLQGLARRHCCR